MVMVIIIMVPTPLRRNQRHNLSKVVHLGSGKARIGSKRAWSRGHAPQRSPTSQLPAHPSLVKPAPTPTPEAGRGAGSGEEEGRKRQPSPRSSPDGPQEEAPDPRSPEEGLTWLVAAVVSVAASWLLCCLWLRCSCARWVDPRLSAGGLAASSGGQTPPRG